jgi:hypothetical protein
MYHIWEKEEAYTGFWLGNLREKTLGKSRHRWKDNIKLDIQKVGCGSMGWMELAQDRDRLLAIANAVMNLRVP